eukprot:g25821.t1
MIHEMPVKLTGSSVTAVEQAADNGVQEWRCSFLEASAATSTRRTRKKRDFKRFLVMRAANAKGQGKQPKAKSAKEKARVRLQRPARHIEAIAANFGRSLRGRQLIRQEAPPAAAAFERLPKALQEAHVEAEGKNSTVHWVPKEPSLASWRQEMWRYNAMIKKQNLDITEVMMRNAMMGKAAMMGPGWDPPGVVSRKIAEILTKT